jgi:C_GCAxxG_C_C family probable redox protein
VSNSKTAKDNFTQGLNCSQAVLSQYADQYDLDIATACKLATGFGGGMGRQGNTCGVLTGAYMVLGLEYGSTTSSEKKNKELTYEKVRLLTHQFEQKQGSCNCRDLLECDISTSEGQQQAREQGLHKTKCPKFVENVVEILDDLLINK